MQRSKEDVIIKAKQSILHAYAPYSMFLVGAAVQTRKGKIYSGCNIENSSLGLTVCAERVALWKAISEGEKEIDLVAIFTRTDNLIVPCGACLQVLSEFNRKMRVVMVSEEKYLEKRIDELLTNSFTLRLDQRETLSGK